MIIETGGPAFPGIRYKQIGDPAYVAPTKFAFEGMTLRDWFAGMAIQGLCANPNYILDSASSLEKMAYDLADKMIQQR